MGFWNLLSAHHFKGFRSRSVGPITLGRRQNRVSLQRVNMAQEAGPYTCEKHRKDRGGWRQGVSQSPASSIWPHLPLSPSPDSPFSPEVISGLTQEGRSLLDSVISRRSHPELCTWDQTLNTWVFWGEILCIWTLSIITNIKTCNVLDSSLCLHLEYLETKGKDDPLSVWGRPWRSKALAGITFRTGTRCSRMGTSLRSEWDTSHSEFHWGRNSLMCYLIVTATLLLGGGKEGEDGIGQNKTTYTIPTSCLRNV